MSESSPKRIRCNDDDGADAKPREDTFIFVHRQQHVFNIWCTFCTAKDMITLAILNRKYAMCVIGFGTLIKSIPHWAYLYRAHFINIPPHVTGAVYNLPENLFVKYKLALFNVKLNWRPMALRPENKAVVYDNEINIPYTLERAVDIAITLSIPMGTWGSVDEHDIITRAQRIWQGDKVDFKTWRKTIRASVRIDVGNSNTTFNDRTTVYVSHAQPRVVFGERFQFLFL